MSNINVRLECLKQAQASHYDPDKVVEAARKYAEFVSEPALQPENDPYRSDRYAYEFHPFNSGSCA